MSFTRRDWLRLAGAGCLGTSGWLPALADQTAGHPRRFRSCILLWMNGGPSQTDTFDMKPGHTNGGPFQPIATSVPGIEICEHLPQLAQQMQHLAVVRSMSTKEGDHTRASFLMRTGYLPQGPVHYPTLGAMLSKELGTEDGELPNYVSVSPYTFLSPAAFGPGFLGPQYSPLVVGENMGAPVGQPGAEYAAVQVKNLSPPGGISREQADARLGMLHELEADFLAQRGGSSAASHQMAYRQAVRMMRSAAVRAFDLGEEPATLRAAYGNNLFGQGCLLARRLVERGVPFVEVGLTNVPGLQVFGWDTHSDNFNGVKTLCSVLDPGWATLIRDLKVRGLLETTMVVWMGEFGRTPQINRSNGRDHFPAAWSTVLCGGGIRGGQVIGKTNAAGTTVEDRPVGVGDLIATICRGLGIDPRNQNMSNVGRPIRLADPESKVIEEALT